MVKSKPQLLTREEKKKEGERTRKREKGKRIICKQKMGAERECSSVSLVCSVKDEQRVTSGNGKTEKKYVQRLSQSYAL